MRLSRQTERVLWLLEQQEPSTEHELYLELPGMTVEQVRGSLRQLLTEDFATFSYEGPHADRVGGRYVWRVTSAGASYLDAPRGRAHG